MAHFFFSLILFFLMLSPYAFAQKVETPPSTSVSNRNERQLGDIFLGLKIGGGLTNFLHRQTYASPDTHILEKGMYFYNLSIMGEFYVAPYSAIVLDIGLTDMRFDRKSTWKNSDGHSSSSERPYEQWFNKFTLAARFLFWNIFYVQTGPSILVNYNSASLIKFMGIDPDINDSPGVSLQWQIGLGASTVVGYKENGDPLMTIDAAFFTYIPVVGSIVDNHSSINAGGNPIHIQSKPYQFEFSLAFMFLV